MTKSKFGLASIMLFCSTLLRLCVFAVLRMTSARLRYFTVGDSA